MRRRIPSVCNLVPVVHVSIRTSCERRARRKHLAEGVGCCRWLNALNAHLVSVRLPRPIVVRAAHPPSVQPLSTSSGSRSLKHSAGALTSPSIHALQLLCTPALTVLSASSMDPGSQFLTASAMLPSP